MPQVKEISLSFQMPFSDHDELDVLTNKLLSELENEDVIVGIGSLRRHRLGVAFFSPSEQHEIKMTAALCDKIASAWPGSRLIPPAPPED